MNDKENPNIEEQINEVSEKLHLDLNFLRSLSADEILWLLDRCPFLQIVNPHARMGDAKPVEIVTAESGWPIHDYGDAMSSSPGPLLYGGGYFRFSADEDEDGEGGGIVNPGKGTIVKQAWDTSVEMVEMAHRHGWNMVEMVDGHPLMQRAAWIKAEQLGLSVVGFTPNKHDKEIRARVEMSDLDVEALKREIKPQR